MVSTGTIALEHGDANEGVELLLQALDVDNAYQEPLLILRDERDKEAQHFFALAYPTLKTQVDFLSDYYFYLIEIGDITTAKQLLLQLVELEPSNDTWQDELDRIQ